MLLHSLVSSLGVSAALCLTLHRAPQPSVHEIADLFKKDDTSTNNLRVVALWLSGLGVACHPLAWLATAFALHQQDYASLVWTLCGATVCALSRRIVWILCLGCAMLMVGAFINGANIAAL